MEKDGKRHRADVFIFDRNVVIEFQQEHLSPSEFKARNDFFISLGHKIIWIFDESIPFSSGAINELDIDAIIKYKWLRASRTFSEFTIEENSNIELWFQKEPIHELKDLALIKILSTGAFGSFREFHGAQPYSKKEFVLYAITGKEKLNRNPLYDVRSVLMRNDGKKYIYKCPESKNPFSLAKGCDGCIHCRQICKSTPVTVECRGFYDDIDLEAMSKIDSVERTSDGFIKKIEGTDENGKTLVKVLVVPNTLLRTLEELWNVYQPLTVMKCANLKNHRMFFVSNPALQKRENGFIKGRVCNWDGKATGGKIEIYGAEKREWIVVWFARPKHTNKKR